MEPTRQTNYIHSSLPKIEGAIRLVTILPDPKKCNSMCCELSLTNLNHDPEYIALSYVWGDASQKRPIVLNRHEVLVTLNLESALRGLRHKSNPQGV